MAALPFDEQDGNGVRGIGDTLRKRRLGEELTTEDAARRAGLPRMVVQGLEQGALTPGDVKTVAYLRMYARSLGLDAEALVRDLTGDELPPAHDTLGDADADAWPSPPGPIASRIGHLRGRWLIALFVVALLVAMAATAGVLTMNGNATVALVSPGQGSGQGSDTVTADTTGTDARTGDRGDPVTAADRGAAGADGSETADSEPESESDPEPEPEPDPEPEPAPPPEPEPAGRAPADTRVQVLHHVTDQAVVDEVVAALEAMGYQVVLVSAARGAFESTTVLYSEGWEVEAQALRSRDARFAEVDVNDRFSDEIDLHVGIGPEWAGEAESDR